jgi:hypothetical protein
VIVATAPEGPLHAGVIDLVADVLRAALGARASVATLRLFQPAALP